MPQRASVRHTGADRVVVENVNVPGYTSTVDGVKYRAMRDVLLVVLPAVGPGLTQAEMIAACAAAAPAEHFPGGSKVGWWAKCVQLDLEAKRLIVRDGGKPLRWRRVGRAGPRKSTAKQAARSPVNGSMLKASADVVTRLDAIAGALPAYRRSMFGTVAWFLDSNAQMFAGVWGDDVNVRVGEEEAARLISSGRASPFEPMQGRAMREYVLVPASTLGDAALKKWVQRGATFAATLPAKKGR